MTNTIKTTAVVADLNKAAPRTQEVCRLLLRKSGITAHDLRDAVGAITKHNAWSLQRMADRFGFIFEVSAEPDANGYKRYYFTKPAKAANTNLKGARAAAAKMTKSARKVAKVEAVEAIEAPTKARRSTRG